jgi:hypothetical protein
MELRGCRLAGANLKLRPLQERGYRTVPIHLEELLIVSHKYGTINS